MLKDTLTCGQEEAGIELPILQLMDDLLVQDILIVALYAKRVKMVSVQVAG